MSAALADLACRTCRGSGWDSPRGDDCACLGRPYPPGTPALRLGSDATDELCGRLARALAHARSRRSASDARLIASQVAAGRELTVRMVACLAGLDDEAAAGVVAAVRAEPLCLGCRRWLGEGEYDVCKRCELRGNYE